MGYMFVSPRNADVETPTSNVLVMEMRTFGGSINHDGEAFMNGTSVLIEDPAELPCPFQAGSTTQELRGGLPPDSGSSTPILQN